MKKLFTSLSFILLVFVLSCEKNETEELLEKKEVELSTDKNSYMNLQDIAFKLCNNTNSNLTYLGCAFGNSPVIELEKYTNEEWIIEHYSLCIEYFWHTLLQNEEIFDTIHSNCFDAGKYRLKCHLMMDSLEIVVCSNMFEIKNEKEIDFSTDKNIYHYLEDIAIRFQNNTSSKLWINWCRLYYRERFENGVWEKMGGPPYTGGYPIVISPNSKVFDTIHNNVFDIGKYRLVTELRKDTAWITVYTNEFVIK